ncbi:MAG: hypothetical protein Q8P67_10490 [archaeon]|nr:hypothetical protein [archaeon]
MVLLVVPSNIKADLTPLLNAPASVLEQFVKIAIEFLRQGETRKKYMVAAQALELPVDVVEHSVEALSWLFAQSARMLIRERDFIDSLIIVGFEHGFARAMWESYSANRKELRQILAEDQVSLPSFKDLRWRLDVQLGSRSVHNVSHVVYLLALHLDGPSPQTIHLQTDLANLKHITQLLEQALQASRSGHVRRIMRNIK